MTEIGPRGGERITKECLACGNEFILPVHFKFRIYCSKTCYTEHRKVAPARRGNNRIAKDCETCGEYFEVFPCRAQARYCSRECGHQARVGKPGTKGNAAGNRGKPTLPRVPKKCPTCGIDFDVQYKDRRRIYCSRTCHQKDMFGKVGPKDRKVAKICPGCGEEFRRSPSVAARDTCCSKACANELRKNATSGNLKDMSEGEIGWLAGLMDGEGSIVLLNRGRPGKGSIRIQIANTYVPLIQRILEVTGVGVVVTHSMKNPKHKTGYTWTVGSGDARELLRRMRPWLLVKAERADAVAEGRSFPRQSRWDHIYPPESQEA